jgi:hypothetical protein
MEEATQFRAAQPFSKCHFFTYQSSQIAEHMTHILHYFWNNTWVLSKVTVFVERAV